MTGQLALDLFAPPPADASAWWWRADRVDLQACTICPAPAGEPCGDYWGDGWTGVHVGRRWKIGITHPGGMLKWAEVERLDHCFPTVEDANEPIEGVTGYTMVYRGCCLGCEWVGPTQTDENSAVEDVHDHVWPRWRELPIAPGRAPQDSKQLRRWLDTMDAARLSARWPAEYLIAAGAPVLTLRAPVGTRSHWSSGHYDICAGIDPNRKPL